MEILEEEVKDIKKFIPAKIPGSELIQCLVNYVAVKIIKTEHKQLTVCFQFPKEYPEIPALIEIKSKVFSPTLVNSITDICDKECKKHIGRKQVILILKFLKTFLDENPLLPCRDEITFVKKNLIKENDVCKVKQKTGVLNITSFQDDYFLKIVAEVPDLYPTHCVELSLTGHNFPNDMAYYFICQAKEFARQATEPPLKKNPKAPPFKPERHLQKVLEFMILKCSKRYPNETCPICNERVLPPEPKDVTNVQTDEHFADRVYCGHLFHHGCLDKYMKTPPFEKGKFCPSCNVRIYHDKWRISPELAERRWAHKEARQREIDEIVDFLS